MSRLKTLFWAVFTAGTEVGHKAGAGVMAYLEYFNDPSEFSDRGILFLAVEGPGIPQLELVWSRGSDELPAETAVGGGPPTGLSENKDGEPQKP